MNSKLRTAIGPEDEAKNEQDDKILKLEMVTDGLTKILRLTEKDPDQKKHRQS